MPVMSEENIVIGLKGLTKRYGYGDTESFALRDFDLTVKRGEFIMIMGPSGCGKTTLLNIIGLLDRATEGEYFLNGENVAGISAGRQARLRAKKIGFIFQNFNLISDLPVLANVSLPLVYTGIPKFQRMRQASAALGRFHLQEREYYMPAQLSGGQQQRVAIARAIVANPEIILADEPTGNLDSRSSHIVMEELKAIHEEGNTIIMVTHNPALTTYATRVINMLDGQIDTDIKTVADSYLPQPVRVRRVRRAEIVLPAARRSVKPEVKPEAKPEAKPEVKKVEKVEKKEEVAEVKKPVKKEMKVEVIEVKQATKEVEQAETKEEVEVKKVGAKKKAGAKKKVGVKTQAKKGRKKKK